jgi:hypothetical protein
VSIQTDYPPTTNIHQIPFLNPQTNNVQQHPKKVIIPPTWEMATKNKI